MKLRPLILLSGFIHVAERMRFRARRSRKPWGLTPRSVDYILTFLLSIGSNRKLKLAYKSYLDGGASPNSLDSIISKSNFVSRGKLRNRLVTQANFPLDISSYDALPSLLPEFDLNSQINSLRLNGFVKLPVKLPKPVVDSLVNLANNAQVRPTKYAHDRSLKPSPDPDIDHIWDVPFATSVQSQEIQKILQDGQLLALAANYLNSNPVVIGSRLYFSLAHKKREFLTPENWHVDAEDGLRFVKLFIALSEIGPNNGPTGFILGSHLNLPRKFYSGRRFFQEELNRNFKGNFVEATGEKGSIYFVDTRGLHRGTPVLEGHRLLFHCLYGTDFFGSARPTTFGLEANACFGDRYRGQLSRTFAAFRSDSPPSTAEIKGP